MRTSDIILAILAGAVLGAFSGSCSGCALFAPEGEASFWSAPADWPGVRP